MPVVSTRDMSVGTSTFPSQNPNMAKASETADSEREEKELYTAIVDKKYQSCSTLAPATGSPQLVTTKSRRA